MSVGLYDICWTGGELVEMWRGWRMGWNRPHVKNPQLALKARLPGQCKSFMFLWSREAVSCSSVPIRKKASLCFLQLRIIIWTSGVYNVALHALCNISNGHENTRVLFNTLRSWTRSCTVQDTGEEIQRRERMWTRWRGMKEGWDEMEKMEENKEGTRWQGVEAEEESDREGR